MDLVFLKIGVRSKHERRGRKMADASTREKWFVWSVSLQVALETAYVAALPEKRRSQT